MQVKPPQRMLTSYIGMLDPVQVTPFLIWLSSNVSRKPQMVTQTLESLLPMWETIYKFLTLSPWPFMAVTSCGE